ncbi:MAG: SDR family oxidoreductase [Syntrophorhabdales bacterium]|jgi:NAD(P)-dependent dehydrogenase (short-subunit alcohol dehydrogenase family)
MGGLEGRVAIVTGGGKGLGRAFCEGFAREGARVLAVTRKDIQGLEETVRRVRALGGEAEHLQIDVTSKAGTDKMAKYAIDRFGRIDILVNNAAFYYGVERKGFDEISEEEWDMMMAVNVKGTWLSIKAVFPYMKQAGKGKIVNLTSEVFFTGSHGFAHYVATKGAVVGLTRALAVELGPHNICINAVAPGFTDTEASRTIADVAKYDTSKTPLKRLGTAEDIVGATVFLSSDAADFITGQTILVDGGRAMH